MRYRSLFESATYGIFRVTTHGKILDANPALVSILGYSSEQELRVLDDSKVFYLDPDDRNRLRGELLHDGTGERIVDWVRRDGGAIKVRLVGHVANDPRARDGCFEIIVEDFTDRLILEKQLRQAQKFEAFGQLAGGIAHDFNNMIGAILGWAEIGLDEAPADSVLRTRFEKIRLQADRAASLTRQLLAFARRQAFEPRHIHVNQIVTETLNLLEKIIGSNIEVKPVLAPDLAAVRADPTQFEQVLMNLCLNARDAMPDGGTLRVETRNVVFDEDFCRRNPHTHTGAHVLLSVSDSGHGMAPATLDRIFEPFFTIKGPAKGTGLGLATVYGVINQHNGIVIVDSELGKGTCFRVYLPVTTEVAPAKVVGGLVTKIIGGTEAILVAEDHEGLRELARETLSGLGYTVHVAADGEEAVALYRQYAKSIQLAVLDVVLPKLSGPEIEAKIIEAGGNIAVIFASGYSPNDGLFRKIQAGPYPLLQKPYTPRDLARSVREALDLNLQLAK
jgi:PAS domain S-box-containing protein